MSSRSHSRDTGYSPRKRPVPCSASAAASMPRSVGKWRCLGFGPRLPRWWETESTKPNSASFDSLRRREVAGILPKADSSSTVARGAAHSSRSVSSRVSASGLEPAVVHRTWRLAVMAQAAVAMASGLSPIVSTTALGRARPGCPRSMKRHSVWRDTPKCRAAWGLPWQRA